MMMMVMIVAAGDAVAAVVMLKVNLKDWWLDYDDVIMALWADGHFVMYHDISMEMSGFLDREFG
jgi:hypothetical protein